MQRNSRGHSRRMQLQHQTRGAELLLLINLSISLQLLVPLTCHALRSTMLLRVTFPRHASWFHCCPCTTARISVSHFCSAAATRRSRSCLTLSLFPSFSCLTPAPP